MAKRKQTTKKTDKELLGMLKFCPKCDDNIIPDDTEKIKSNFCPDCGTKLIQPSRCIWCGTPVHASTTYCPACGELILRKEIM